MARTFKLLPVLLLLMAAGCGFQLRTTDISALSELHLAGASAAPATFRSLKAQLLAQGVATSSDSADAFRVRLLDERTIRRSVATSSIIDAAEYELRLEVDVSISRGDGEAVIDTIAVQRVYAVDAVNLSASTEEQRLLIREMREDMTRNILRRIEILARAT